MVFLNLRQRIDTVQGLLIVAEGKVSKQMVKWAGSLADESIVLVEGVVKKLSEPVKSCTVGDVEIHITQVRIHRNQVNDFNDKSWARSCISLLDLRYD